ncbi:MAG: hypothetical protein ABEK01_02355 [Candidatus Nanohaloarchaea archaeon]
MRAVQRTRDGGDESALVVVNPLYDVIGDRTDEVFRLASDYQGDTFRANNVEYISDPTEGFGEYDDTYLFDDEGLDRIDARELADHPSVDFAGGSLEEIEKVYSSLREEDPTTDYGLVPQFTYDWTGVDERGEPMEDAMERFSNILSWDHESALRRLERKGMEDLI